MPTLRESCEFALVRYGGTLMTPQERRIALPLARAADGDAAARRALRAMVDDVLRRTRLRNTAAARAAADALRVKA
jgi:hypothetical protein